MKLRHNVMTLRRTLAGSSKMVSYPRLIDGVSLTSGGAEYAKSDPRDEKGNKIFTVPELEWFRKNAYNIGVTKCHE